MSYTEFINYIKDYFTQQTDANTRVNVKRIIKNNNVTLHALTILPPNCNITPSIYLDSFYEEYCNGTTMDIITDKIYTLYQTYQTPTQFNTNLITNYGNASQKIAYKLINYNANQELLKDVPYIPFLDLAIIFYLIFDEVQTGQATALIHNSHLGLWDIDLDTLFETASNNTPILLGEDFIPMQMLMQDLFPMCEPESPEETMYVLTNKKRHNGAAVILNTSLLTTISQMLDSDFYILPSSIHEVIILPCSDVLSEEELSTMVREINDSDVDETEVLSNHVYKFVKSSAEIIY